jgi:hypothetical protein
MSRHLTRDIGTSWRPLTTFITSIALLAPLLDEVPDMACVAALVLRCGTNVRFQDDRRYFAKSAT